MKEYITSAITVCAVCAVVNMLCESNKLEKQIRFVLSLCVVAVICAPVLSSLDGIGAAAESFIYELGASENIDASHALGSEAAGVWIEDTLCRKFGIKKENIEVSASIEIIGEQVIFERACVYLSGGGALANIPEIKKYVQNALGCECEVNIVAP